MNRSRTTPGAVSAPSPQRSAFSYRAVHVDGTMEHGVLDAEGRDAAAARLAQRGLFALEIEPRAVASARRRAMPVAELALGLRLLGDLLLAGLPMGRALTLFEELAPPAWRAMLPSIQASIREGAGLATAMANAPVALPPLVLGIVSAGEAGSGIGSAVRNAADIMEETAASRAAIRAALAYPMMLAVAGTASVAVLVGAVLPRFQSVLADLGRVLPPGTQLLLDTAGMLRTAAVPGAIVLALTVAVWRTWVSHPEGRQRWHAALLRLPVLGDTRLAAASARGCGALAALLHSGVPLAHAMVHAARATGDGALEARMRDARQATIQGARLSRALSDCGAMSPTAVRLARAGEETGRLADMLAHAARIERERATQLTRSAVRLLEPALILVFGGLVALVAAALLQAIYSVRPGT